jgi:hypothetical protein
MNEQHGDYETQWHTDAWAEALDNEARMLAPTDPGDPLDEMHFTPYDTRYMRYL